MAKDCRFWHPGKVQPAPKIHLPRAWYAADIEEFCRTSESSILGELIAHAETEIVSEQTQAWQEQIRILQRELEGLHGLIALEFNIPRMGRRADAIVFSESVVWVLEFKSGNPQASDLEQVWDYALDLKNFHSASHDLPVIPLVIYTAQNDTTWPKLTCDSDQVYHPVKLSPIILHDFLQQKIPAPTTAVTSQNWMMGIYRPTPTIIEAARALYARHDVQDILHYDAEDGNLALTSGKIVALAQQAFQHRQKIICFVTGVPGSGKTLVGLKTATQKWSMGDSHHAVYLSGNGPLVDVLSEALTRDEWTRCHQTGKAVHKNRVRQNVKQFIQNIHHFRDECLRNPAPPSEHVVIFDEAQRAWNQKKTANFMLRRKKISNFSKSEPYYLISCMDRFHDWALIVCLVGQGQEINEGEAGIQEWMDSLHDMPAWQIHLAPELKNQSQEIRTALSSLSEKNRLQFDDALYLSASVRSFRAENLSAFVQSLLAMDKKAAMEQLPNLKKYPIVICRDPQQAKDWIRQKARASDRYGLLMSSKAFRLKPLAMDVRVKINPIHYFLNGRDDTRSSFYLEDAATEFQVQGLELDWSCVTWDADLRCQGDGWCHHNFNGRKWENILNKNNRAYLINAYRVLLTRARQGMVIMVPRGDASDPTRLPAFYDGTFQYLSNLGLPVLH